MTSRYSRATRTWSRAVALSGIGVGQSIGHVAASPSGAAAADWAPEPADRPADTVEASYRDAASSAWQPAVAIYSNRGADVRSSQVGIDAAGNAYATWSVNGRTIEMAEHPAGASGWTAPVTVARGSIGMWTTPILAVSPTGTLALAWQHFLRGGLTSSEINRMDLKVRPAGSSVWLPTVDLGPEGVDFGEIDANPHPYAPQIAVSPNGNVFVGWQWRRRIDNYYPGVAILMAADGWRPRVVALPAKTLGPSVAGDDRGVANVLYRVGSRPEVATLSPTARILRIERLPDCASQIVADGRGDLATVGCLGAAVRPAGQKNWCPPVALKTSEQQIAIAPDGTAAALWHQASTRPNAPLLARVLTPCPAR